MASVTYGKCYLWQTYYGKCNYGKSIYGISIMANETEPTNHRHKFIQLGGKGELKRNMILVFPVQTMIVKKEIKIL